jgi:hypothetical protein
VKAKAMEKLLARQSISMKMIKHAEAEGERYDAEAATWLHGRIADWYRERHAERVALGGSPPVPLATVLACHDAGELATVPERLVAAAAGMEDEPGAWESEDCDE